MFVFLSLFLSQKDVKKHLMFGCIVVNIRGVIFSLVASVFAKPSGRRYVSLSLPSSTDVS